MMQTTLFIGPVDFYWTDRHGQRQRREMNTGDSGSAGPETPCLGRFWVDFRGVG